MLSLLKYVYDQKWNKSANEASSDTENERAVPDFKDEEVGIEEVQLPEEKELEQLRHDLPDIFLTNHRNVLGHVVKMLDDENKIEVNADSKRLVVDLANIKTECIHDVGDRIYVRCYVESEELFSGELIETFEPFGIIPANKRKHQKCMVESIEPECVILNNECYINKRVLNEFGDKKLNIGDFLHVDMIECSFENFKWRCTYFMPQKSSEFIELTRGNKNYKLPGPSKTEESKRLVLPAPSGRWNNYQTRLCEYANQVWSQEIGELVPGVSLQPQRRFKAVRIPVYEIPYNIRITYLTEYQKFKIAHHPIERYFASLGKELSYKNYVERFQLLLWLEEVELFKNFRQYDIERAQFSVDADCLAVTIINLGERRPSLVIGDKVRAYSICVKSATKREAAAIKPKCFEGIVYNVGIDKALLKFQNFFHETYKGESYRLEFYFSRVNFRRKHYAIHRAIEHLGKEFLFPETINLHERPQLDIRLDEKENNKMSTADDTIEWHNPNLNELQRKAVFNILRCEANMPYVIYGPPGTGKTITLIECILQLVSNLPQSRLLVATPSNSAANLLCSRLIESKGLHLGEMVRVVPHNLVERDQIPESILPYCATADLGEDGTFEENMFVARGGLQMNCPMRVLSRYRVTIGTCSTLGKYLELGFNKDHFTHVLIDEAGQCSEPDIMIPLSQVAKSRGQVIVAGDPMQLQAIVINKHSDEKGLSMSFLERLMNTAPYRKDLIDYEKSSGYNPILMTKLRQNYRALPSIMRIYNYLFYDLELQSTISTTDSQEVGILKKLDKKVLFPSEKRPLSHGAFFYAVRGENMRERDSPSWYNPREANVVFNTTLELYRAGLKPDDIGIISPYLKQVKYIRALFVKAKLLYPKIGSVEEFQGQERNVILLSTVRTARRELRNYDSRFGLGFVKSERRLNVAISRARALLIVFGDSSLLRLDDCWGIYIGDCCSNDSFFGLKSQQDDESVPKSEKDKNDVCEDKKDDDEYVDATATK